jgi:hypothetical protein
MGRGRVGIFVLQKTTKFVEEAVEKGAALLRPYDCKALFHLWVPHGAEKLTSGLS